MVSPLLIERNGEMMTTAAPTREFARAIGEAMAAGRWDEVLANVDNDVVAHVPKVGDLFGSDALAGFVLETAAKTDNGETFELIDALVGDHHAGLYFRITAQRAGRPPLDNFTVHLARIDQGLIAEIWFHNFDSEVVAAFWA